MSSLESSSKEQKEQKEQRVIKKRNRALLSCTTCHSRRVKCDRGLPCIACINYGTDAECFYASRPNKRSQKQDTEKLGESSTQRIETLHSYNSFVERVSDVLRGAAVSPMLIIILSITPCFRLSSMSTAEQKRQVSLPISDLTRQMHLPRLEEFEIAYLRSKEQNC
jgi:hypothetical protein